VGAPFAALDPARLRFHLGASLADLQVPVHVDPEARAIVRAAAAQAGVALTTAHKRHVPAGELDRIYLREDYASLPPIVDALGPVGGGPDLRAAAHLGLQAHPALPGSVICAWMGPGGRGRSLTALWIGVMRAAFGERATSGTGEETPLLVAMALVAELQAAAAGLREVLPGAPLDRYLRAAALAALWVASRTGLARAVRDAGLASDDRMALRLDAVLNPGALLGGRAAVPSGGSTLYGVELVAGVPEAEETAARLAAGADPEAAAADLAAALGADEEVARRAEAAVAVARLRGALSTAILGAEEAGHGAAAVELRALLAAPGALANAAGDEDGRRQLGQQAQQALARSTAGEPAAALEVALRALRGWKAREPAAGLGLRREQARAEYAAAATALLADVALDRMWAPARRTLALRTGAEAEGGAEAEWAAGRLYRISPRPGAILRVAREHPVAHLFADVKDFTRRTGLLGQAAMAEFLRREFYLPILAAARQRMAAVPRVGDRGGVSVNNLLGDAISLSGDIEVLVGVAMEIPRLLAAYETRLARAVGDEVVAGRVAALEASHLPAIQAAARARAQAREAASRAPEGSPERAEAQRRLALAAAAEGRQVAERNRAVARARGEGLEAGVFVSHGAAPLVVAIEDDVFGKNRVAIAEKINESARGTARAPTARARADQLLQAAREARGLPDLRHAWSVFIGQPLALSIPPAAEAAALRAARAGDMATAMHAVAGPVRAALEAAARADDLGTGDVYNAGAALSGEALEAFLESVSDRRVVRRIEMEPGDVPPELAREAWFGPGAESLVATFHADGRPAELFRYAGRAWFKGLGEVPVWEIAADVGAPAALFRAMRERWLGGRGVG
jgi:hypothetical protein